MPDFHPDWVISPRLFAMRDALRIEQGELGVPEAKRLLEFAEKESIKVTSKDMGRGSVGYEQATALEDADHARRQAAAWLAEVVRGSRDYVRTEIPDIPEHEVEKFLSSDHFDEPDPEPKRAPLVDELSEIDGLIQRLVDLQEARAARDSEPPPLSISQLKQMLEERTGMKVTLS